MILQIKMFDNPILRQKSEPVKWSKKIKRLIKDMKDTLIANKGLGLAAPQIGKNLRLIVTINDVLINPEIIESSNFTSSIEQCLSCPGKKININRAAYIKVAYINDSNKHCIKEFKDLNAFCIQHELDHLDGKLIIDYEI